MAWLLIVPTCAIATAVAGDIPQASQVTIAVMNGSSLAPYQHEILSGSLSCSCLRDEGARKAVMGQHHLSL